MADVFIIGNGGHARVIASMLSGAPAPKFVTTAPDTEDQVLGALVADHPRAELYVGIGTDADRRRIADKLRALGGRLPPCIAPNAFIARDAHVADAAVICLGAQIGSRAQIGFACIVNTLSSIDHDGVLGDYTQVTVGVTFGGRVTVGKGCFFGMKSAVFPNCSIGDGVIVRAGALVTKDVPSGVMVGGAPARVVRGA